MTDQVFDFLDDLELEEVTGRNSAGGVKFGGIDKNPVDADLRLFPDGSMYPSKELVKEFNLEYQPKDSTNPEYGFDIFSSKHWGQYQTAKKAYKAKTGKDMPEIIVISPVSRHSAKVDAFGKTTYKKDGSPKSSVIDQGASTFGKQMIDEIFPEVLGKDPFAEGKAFIDLKINRENRIPSTQNGIYNIPKKLVKGKDAGKFSYTRRENAMFYPLTVVEQVSGEVGGRNHLRDQMDAQAANAPDLESELNGGDYADEPLLKTSD